VLAAHICVFFYTLQVITETRAHHVATLLDTKGPEIRTAMLQGGKDIQLTAGSVRCGVVRLHSR
jgi:pyruvate kinase